MSSLKEKVEQGWKEIRGNLVVEVAKWIGGSTVVGAIFKAISQAAHRVPVDWVLFACLLLVGLLLIVFSLYRRGEQQQEQHRPAPYTAPLPSPSDDRDPDRTRRIEAAHKAELWRAQESRRQCDEERREALNKLAEAKSQLAMFTPLQIETFQLAKDLRSFMNDLGPRPSPQRDGKAWQHDGSPEWLIARNEVEVPWVLKLANRYERVYAPKVKDQMHKLAEVGINALELSAYTQQITGADDVFYVAKKLDELAIMLNATV